MSPKDKLNTVRTEAKATLNEKLDEALKESFPASDPVALGHSEHIGQPKPARKKDSKLPKGSAGLKGKRQ